MNILTPKWKQQQASSGSPALTLLISRKKIKHVCFWTDVRRFIFFRHTYRLGAQS